MNSLQLFSNLKVLRAVLLTFAALGAVGSLLFGCEHMVVKHVGNFRIFEHERVVVQGQVKRDIDTVRTGHAVSAAGAINFQHLPVGTGYPAYDVQFAQCQRVDPGILGDLDVLLDLRHGAHATQRR